MIRTVVFDIGGVLVRNPLDEFSKLDVEYGLQAGTAMSLFRGGSRFVECETGRMPFGEFCAGAAMDIHAEQGITVPADRIATMMGSIVGGGIVEAMRELVLDLKAAGMQIGLCSNIYAEVDDWIHTMLPPGTVDVYCLSYKVGQRKPETAIYAALIDMCGHQAEEIVFIDDWMENVTGARELGIEALVFSEPSVLRTYFNEAGILGTPALGHHSFE